MARASCTLGLAQLAVNPCDLLLVHQVGVEDAKADVRPGECVIALAAHVEALVKALFRVVVIPERGEERNARLQ